jgi:hypothetical protein
MHFVLMLPVFFFLLWLMTGGLGRWSARRWQRAEERRFIEACRQASIAHRQR